MYSFYAPKELISDNFELEKICEACHEVLAMTKASNVNIVDYLKRFESSYPHINRVMRNFLYGLVCDYFATIKEDDRLLEPARVAYTNAMTLYQQSPERFSNLQRHYQRVLQTANNPFSKILYQALAELSLLNMSDAGTKEKCETVLAILVQNLHLYEGEKKELASKLINFAESNKNREIVAKEFAKFQWLAFDLQSFISIEENCYASFGLADQLATLKMNDQSDRDGHGKLWLVNDLLATDKVVEFIDGMIMTLPIRGEKRSLDESHDLEASVAIAEQNPIVALARRIVRAKRRMQVDNQAEKMEGEEPVDTMDVEMKDQDDQDDQFIEDSVQQKTKRSKF